MSDECKDRMKAKAKKFFDDADASGDGALNKLELAKVVKKMGFSQSNDEIVEWFSDLDTNKDGMITFVEFIGEVVDKRDPSEVQEAELRQVFESCDKDDSGKVSAGELRKYVKDTMGSNLSDENLESIISSADTSGDGMLGCDEFLAAWSGGQ